MFSQFRLRWRCARDGCCWALLLLPLLCSCEHLNPQHQTALLSEAVSNQWKDWRDEAKRSLVGAAPEDKPLSIRQKIARAQSALRLNVNAVDAPVESVLYALAADSGLELQVHQPINRTVTLRAHRQTVDAVLSMLAQQAPIYWQQEAGRLDVWGSDPFSRSYAVEYLNMDRTTLSSVGLATQVGSINANSDDGATAVTNSSETLIRNQVLHRFWESLESDLNGLVDRGKQLNSQSAFTINRDAGMVTVFANAKAHQLVKAYLDQLHNSVKRQVVIEATVVEVTLSDQFEAGVDWQFLADGVDGISGLQKLLGVAPVEPGTASRLPSPSALFTMVQQSSRGNMRATLSLLRQFGDVRILSRPRIIALNNQSSVLKVVDNRVYFTVNIERSRGDTSDRISTESEIHTVPVGLVMNVTPFIGADNEVMLNVRPSLSRIIGFVNDPNPELAESNVRNGVPEIQVREMESMLRVKSGELAVIGGLMQDVVENNRKELPGLARLPGLASLFSSHQRSRRQTELLVVLKPTVMDEGSSKHQTAFSQFSKKYLNTH